MSAPRAVVRHRSVLGRVPQRGTGAITILGLLVVWQAVIDFGVLTYQYLPTPVQIAQAVPEMLTDTPFVEDVSHTVGVTLAGWAIASGVGVVIGSLLGLSEAVWTWSGTSIEMMRSIPGITLVPLAALVFGLSSKMELTVVIYVALWPVLIGTVTGLRNVPSMRHDVSRTLRLGRARSIPRVILPSAASSIVVGMRLSLTFSLVLAVVAEMVGNPSGLGYRVIVAQESLQPSLMFALVLVVGLLGIVLNAVFGLVARRVLPGLYVAGVVS